MLDHQSLILALNETRKTLPASRLSVTHGSRHEEVWAAADILPGDGVWLNDCNCFDTAETRARTVCWPR